MLYILFFFSSCQPERKISYCLQSTVTLLLRSRWFNCVASWLSLSYYSPLICCRSHDVIQARTRVFPQCCYGVGLRTLVRLRAFSIAITRGLRHNAKVRESIRGCEGDFIDVRASVLARSDVTLPTCVFLSKIRLLRCLANEQYHL